MSTGMRKWMEKGCPDIPTTPAEVSIGREELRQLRDELAQYKNERDALRAKVERMEKQEPVGTALLCTRCSTPFDGDHYCPACGYHTATEKNVYALPGAQPAPSVPDGVIDRLAALPARITPEQAPDGVRDYCHEAAEGYADGWNACIKAMTEKP